MSQSAIVEQLRKDRRELRLTIREVADLTNTPEATAKKVFSSSSAQNFTSATLQPYIDLFDSMLEKVSDDSNDSGHRTDAGHAELSVVLLRLYREKCEEIDALRIDSERRDLRHSRINLIQTIIIALLVAFILFWLVYDVLYLDRGWIRSMFSCLNSFFDRIRTLI